VLTRYPCIVVLLFAALSAAAQSAPIGENSIIVERDRGYQPITGEQRLKWFAKSTVGPQSLGSGLLTSAIGTARNSPQEYGGSWTGFGQRYGMRLTGISTGNAMEAGLGSLWGEDPRYFRAPNRSMKSRIGNAVLMTFAARRRDGQLGPAYARFAAIPGNNFLSNTWRADSESSAGDAAMRTLWGFLGRMASNAFQEFWPDISKRVFHRNQR
jgi:hypothetical protein